MAAPLIICPSTRPYGIFLNIFFHSLNKVFFILYFYLLFLCIFLIFNFSFFCSFLSKDYLQYWYFPLHDDCLFGSFYRLVFFGIQRRKMEKNSSKEEGGKEGRGREEEKFLYDEVGGSLFTSLLYPFSCWFSTPPLSLSRFLFHSLLPLLFLISATLKNSFSLLFPLFFFTLPLGDVTWNEYGHLYSWRMKLRDKNCYINDIWSYLPHKNPTNISLIPITQKYFTPRSVPFFFLFKHFSLFIN